MNPDQINGAFEMIGGALVFLNVWQVYKDKMVRGINWWVMVFFTSWGFWNLYFYPHYGLWWSFWGGVLIAIGNVCWLVMAWHYGRLEKYETS